MPQGPVQGGPAQGGKSPWRADLQSPPTLNESEHRLYVSRPMNDADDFDAVVERPVGACPSNGHGLHRPRMRECQERRRRRCRSIVKPSRRRNRASWVDPKGPRFRGPGTSSAVACDAPSIAAQRHSRPRPRKRGAARDHYPDRLLEDDIIANGKAVYIRRQLLAGPAQERMFRQHPAGPLDPVEKEIGASRAIGGDVETDIGEIGKRRRRCDDARHQS